MYVYLICIYIPLVQFLWRSLKITTLERWVWV